jgi:hypothetical protein
MAIDTTASTVATNALQAIPFSSLIGGPLDACVQAQAQAARTSYEFINQVGLTVDPITGEKKAINVTFQYNNQGQLATLVVPLIAIVPIPYLGINTVEIDFIANISASSSSVSETSSDSELGVDVTAEAALSVGPFSLKINANANYSSKQHSKASQDSKYSVEYTMGVKVQGGSTDMPAGLATVLNILQGSITSTSPNELMMLSANSLDINKQRSGTMQVTIHNNQGLVVPGVEVALTVLEKDSPFKALGLAMGKTPAQIRENIRSGKSFTIVEKSYSHYYGLPGRIRLSAHDENRQLLAAAGSILRNGAGVNGDGQTIVGTTDKNGTVIFKFELREDVFQGNESLTGKLKFASEIPMPGADGKFRLQPEVEEVPYFIIPFGPTLTLSASVTKVNFAGTAGEEHKIIITAIDDMSVHMANMLITTSVTLDQGDLNSVFENITVSPKAPDTTPNKQTATGLTGDDGQVTFTYKLAAAATKSNAGVISFDCSGLVLDVPLTIK